MAIERFSLTPQGHIKYSLKTPYRDGAIHVLFEPLDFIARLASLVPSPRVNLTRYHGIFAPHHRLRAQIVPSARGAQTKKGQGFRFIGLAFLVPGVVSPELPSSFAHAAAYGDIIAATLALLSLASLSSGAGFVIAWIFNLWGSADLLNAFYQANDAGLVPGQLGVTFFIPTFVVPLLLITHALAFRILLQRQSASAMQESWQPGDANVASANSRFAAGG